MNKSKLDAIRKLANGEIKSREFSIAMGIGKTTTENYVRWIRYVKTTGKRPNTKSVGKEFQLWADEWEREHHIEEKGTQTKEQNRRIKYKIELTVWEYM